MNSSFKNNWMTNIIQNFIRYSKNFYSNNNAQACSHPHLYLSSYAEGVPTSPLFLLLDDVSYLLFYPPWRTLLSRYLSLQFSTLSHSDTLSRVSTLFNSVLGFFIYLLLQQKRVRSTCVLPIINNFKLIGPTPLYNTCSARRTDCMSEMTKYCYQLYSTVKNRRSCAGCIRILAIRYILLFIEYITITICASADRRKKQLGTVPVAISSM